MQSTYESLCRYQRELALLTGVSALLSWDERAMLPTGGGAHRADQLSYLSGIIHQRQTDPRLGDWLAELEESDLAKDAYSEAGATVHELKRSYEKQIKIPQKLVEELTHATVLGQQLWVTARQADDFAKFQPQLEEIIRLTREKIDAIGYATCPYDVLLDDYEPQASTAEIARVLHELGEQLGPLVRSIAASGKSSPHDILRRKFPIPIQRKFGTMAAQAIGFDFDAGRLDETHHPLCTTLGPHDCRITTRYDENFFSSAFFGTLHEAGHGLYEQGLREEFYGLPPGEAASMGAHESQSRLWENFVGRSRPFWEHFFPLAVEHFPAALEDVSLNEFYWAINDVRPNLIRVEADEATYNLHIIIRFELERKLFEEDLPVADLPAAWNEKYEHYLGITPPNDADGVLQDIHWSAGLFGYFATYSLGNLYAAQLFEKASNDIGDLPAQIAQGEFGELLTWLRENVHASGRTKPAERLIADVCHAPLSSQPLMSYLRNKLNRLYGIA